MEKTIGNEHEKKAENAIISNKNTLLHNTLTHCQGKGQTNAETTDPTRRKRKKEVRK